MTTTLPAGMRRVGNSLQVTTTDTVASFDRTGRFLRVVRNGQVVRRKLNGQLVRMTEVDSQTHLRVYEALPKDVSASILADIYQEIATLDVQPDSNPEAFIWLQKALSWSQEALQSDEKKFNTAYLPVSILPPGEYQSVVVQLTEGCSYNQCRFCDFYRDRPFRVKTEEELLRHLNNIRDLFGARLQDRTGIFLGDGNALVVSPNRLLNAMDMISQQLPEVPQVYSTFMDTFNIEHKNQQDLQHVRQQGLANVYVGLESGHDPLRQLLRKPGDAAEALASIVKLKDAGFRLGIMVMVGIGQGSLAERHLEDTRAILEQVHWDSNDTIFVSPFVEPHYSPDWPELAKELGGGADTGYGKTLAEAQKWIHLLNQKLAAKVSLYSVLEHLY